MTLPEDPPFFEFLAVVSAVWRRFQGLRWWRGRRRAVFEVFVLVPWARFTLLDSFGLYGARSSHFGLLATIQTRRPSFSDVLRLSGSSSFMFLAFLVIRDFVCAFSVPISFLAVATARTRCVRLRFTLSCVCLHGVHVSNA